LKSGGIKTRIVGIVVRIAIPEFICVLVDPNCV
jgi:hypothetical protein